MRPLLPLVVLALAGAAFQPAFTADGERADQLIAQLDQELARLAKQDPTVALAARGRQAADLKAAQDSAVGGGAGPEALKMIPTTTLTLVTVGGGSPLAEMDQVLTGLELTRGPQEKGGNLLLVATDLAQVHGKPGTAAWATGRAIAFQSAELRARAQLVRFLSEEVLSGRNLKVLEDAGAITDPTLPPAKPRTEIAQQAATMADAQLDAELRKLGVPPEQYQNQAPEKKRVIFSEAYESYIRTRAASTLMGTATLAVTEGPMGGNQALCVAVVWSTNLAKLAGLFSRHGGELPPRPPMVGKRLAEQIPVNPLTLARSFGVQRCVDETGEIVLVAYGQSGLAEVPAAMRVTAMSNALAKAELEAKAMLKAFVYEETSVRASRDLGQLAAVTQGEQTGKQEVTLQQESRFMQDIRSGGDKLNLIGAARAKEWNAKLDGTDVMGVVVTWSPRAMRLARQAAEQNAKTPGNPAAPGTGGAGTAGSGTTFDPAW